MLDKQTQEIHKRVAQFFKPIDGYVLIEFVKNLKTTGGVYLPDTGTMGLSIAHPVVAKAEDADWCNVGDWVSVTKSDANVFELYGRSFSFLRKFDCWGIVDMRYMKDSIDYKAEQAKPKLEIVK